MLVQIWRRKRQIPCSFSPLSRLLNRTTPKTGVLGTPAANGSE